MNILFLIFFGIAVIALIVFLVRRNNKDEKVFEGEMNKDYPISKEEKGDGDIETVIK
jgi:hypothetical protein